ncbi:unnamed protein product, partial [Scytosiphon promiscuus]
SLLPARIPGDTACVEGVAAKPSAPAGSRPRPSVRSISPGLSTMAAAGATSLPSVPPPAPEVQREMIAEAMKLEMKQGQVWYVLGSKWWQLWQAYVRFGEQAAAEPAPTPPGGGDSLAPTPTAGSAPPAAAASAAADSRSNSNSSSMDEDGVMVKAEQEAGYGVVVKADANEHRVAGLSLEEEGARGGAG